MQRGKQGPSHDCLGTRNSAMGSPDRTRTIPTATRAAQLRAPDRVRLVISAVPQLINSYTTGRARTGTSDEIAYRRRTCSARVTDPCNLRKFPQIAQTCNSDQAPSCRLSLALAGRAMASWLRTSTRFGMQSRNAGEAQLWLVARWGMGTAWARPWIRHGEPPEPLTGLRLAPPLACERPKTCCCSLPSFPSAHSLT